MPPTGTQYQWWQTFMSQRTSGIGNGCPGHQSCGTVKLSRGTGLLNCVELYCGARLLSAWAMPAASPEPATATPPDSSAPAISLLTLSLCDIASRPFLDAVMLTMSIRLHGLRQMGNWLLEISTQGSDRYRSQQRRRF